MAVVLMDELVEAILLRISPDDPACLACAALVCRRWYRIISDPSFHRRYHELHHTPPMLGFFRNHGTVSSFVSTSSFHPLRATCRNFPAIDARHGHVLLHSVPWELGDNPLDHPFVVWNPITGERRELPLLPWSFDPYSWNAVVLCASTDTCDHLTCQRGPFLVVLVGTDQDGMFSYVYSSETAAWSEEVTAPYPGGEIILAPSVLIGNALYFLFWYSESIMKFDLGTREMSTIQVPLECSFRRVVLMTSENSGLGLAYMENYELYMWSMEVGPEGNAGWAQNRVIELETFLPVDALSDSLDVAGFADGADVVIVRSYEGLFTIDLKSCQVTKVCGDGWYYGNFPYVSFCTPAAAAAALEAAPAV